MTDLFEFFSENDSTDFFQITVKNKNTGELISVLPRLGARLNRVLLLSNNSLHSVVHELTEANFSCNDERFNNAKLFPFAGRVEGGVYSFNGSQYALPVNYKSENNACHGYVYDKVFRVLHISQNETSATITLMHTIEQGFEGYPFSWDMQVSYTLSSGGTVHVETCIANANGHTMLFSDGWHPYFKLGDSVDDLFLDAPFCRQYQLGKSNIPSGKFTELEGMHMPLADRQFDDVFRLEGVSRIHQLRLSSDALGVSLNIWQETGKYDYTVIYTPPSRKVIAIEPMSSNVNAFNNQEGTIVLQPNEKWTASFGFSLTDIQN